MKLYIQWATANPGDWQPLDIRTLKHIRDLPRKPAPRGGETIDNQPGWVNAINVQGIVFSGYDHIGVDLSGDGLRIVGWQDDTEDFGDTRWATEWVLNKPAPDARLGGRINTVQARTIYATPDAAVWFPGVQVRPWSEFNPPPVNQTLHGIWLPESQWQAHMGVLTPHGWREWIE